MSVENQAIEKLIDNSMYFSNILFGSINIEQQI